MTTTRSSAHTAGRGRHRPYIVGARPVSPGTLLRLAAGLSLSWIGTAPTASAQAPVPAAPAQPPAPAPPFPTPPPTPPSSSPPPLPSVPQTTPPATDPATVSPATPGVNLDAPPSGPARPAPTDRIGAQDTPVPAGDERGVLFLDSADQQNFLGSDDRVVLEGNVRLRYNGFRIRADRVTYSENAAIATFENNVVIETGRQTINADFLALNLRTRAFTTRGGQTVVPPEFVGPNLLQPLRLSGAGLDRDARILVAEGGFLTTCDYDDPHFKIGFQKATLIPNRRLILRRATLYKGQRKIFTLPYLVIPVREDIRYSYLPQVGRTEEEGVFVKTALGYALGDTLPGLFRLDVLQKKGVGVGFDQAYRFGRDAAGTLILYSLRDQGRGLNNLNGRLSHSQQVGEVALAISSDFQQNSYNAASPTSKSQNTTLSATRGKGASTTTASLNLSDSNYGFGANRNTAYTLAQSLPLPGGGAANFRFNGSETASASFGATSTATTRTDQTGDLRANTRVGPFTLDLAANKQLASRQSGGGNTGSFFSGTERLPELTLSTDSSQFRSGLIARTLRSVPTRFSLGYGRFVEGISTGRAATDRALFDVNATPRPIPLVGNVSLQLGGGLRQTLYNGGNTAQYLLSSQSTLTQRIDPRSSLNFTYGYLRPYGAPPTNFRLDQSGSFNNVGANLAVSGDRVRFSLLTGYDIQRAQLKTQQLGGLPKNPWQNLALQLALRPSAVFQTRFTASYDINADRLIDLTNRVRVRTPSGLALDTGFRFDPRTKKFPQITGVLETPLGDGSYNVSAFAGYNGNTNKFDYKNFALTRSYHDYEITLTYTDQPYGFRSERGFQFGIRLKAFPTFQRTGVGQYGTAIDTGGGEVF